MSPQRIQRKRTKGWRTPLCSCGCGKPARYVGRSTRWGNPWGIGATVTITSRFGPTRQILESIDAPAAVDLYRVWITRVHIADVPFDPYRLSLSELRGHDLACWCPLDQPCHADILLQLANRGEQP